jgi:hypothetical protein
MGLLFRGDGLRVKKIQLHQLKNFAFWSAENSAENISISIDAFQAIRGICQAQKIIWTFGWRISAENDQVNTDQITTAIGDFFMELLNCSCLNFTRITTLIRSWSVMKLTNANINVVRIRAYKDFIKFRNYKKFEAIWLSQWTGKIWRYNQVITCPALYSTEDYFMK